uniref:Ig-like domain-containing protein n=1 Tax=Pygocentrus nattereri TaxID=42514 RepID=A0AAR2KBV4_PYGNA
MTRIHKDFKVRLLILDQLLLLRYLRLNRKWNNANLFSPFDSDLQVEVPERVIEGDEVTLTCKTTCSLTVRRAFTWYRDGHPLSSSTDQLHLQPVSREDAGRYRCAVLGQNLQSPEVTLNTKIFFLMVLAAQCPDLNLIEKVCLTLNRNKPSSIFQLFEVASAEWNNIDSSIYKRPPARPK